MSNLSDWQRDCKLICGEAVQMDYDVFHVCTLKYCYKLQLKGKRGSVFQDVTAHTNVF